MDLIGLIKKRRSVREFADSPIPERELEKIVDAARFAPTARNVQPWEFVAVTAKDTLKEIGRITDHGKFIAAATACIAVFSKDTKYYLEDCCAATENLMLAAAALGVASCWVAGDKKPYGGTLVQLMGVPQGYKLVSLVALGYPLTGEVFREVEKRSLAEVLHWQRF
ncbi:MAG: nitroreductase family protein [Candidatus Omnitrophica bacterium]|nr:nitroreductase family protein [Candidatus Omnitrophota bacterium]